MPHLVIGTRIIRISIIPTEEEEYLINLIDSPGHVDFSSEVGLSVAFVSYVAGQPSSIQPSLPPMASWQFSSLSHFLNCPSLR